MSILTICKLLTNSAKHYSLIPNILTNSKLLTICKLLTISAKLFLLVPEYIQHKFSYVLRRKLAFSKTQNRVFLEKEAKYRIMKSRNTFDINFCTYFEGSWLLKRFRLLTISKLLTICKLLTISEKTHSLILNYSLIP